MMNEIVVAGLAIAGSSCLRLLIDHFFPDVVPFPLVFPALVIATLAGGGRAGLLTIIGCQMLIWYYVVPFRSSLIFETPGDAIGLMLATAAQLLLLWFVVRYGRAQHEAVAVVHAQRDELERTVRRMEEQAASNARLRENLEAIYNASGDGLALCEAYRNADGHIYEYQALEVNRAHAELTAATREQMLGQPISTIYPPIDPRWFETAEKAIDTGEMQDFDIRSRATGRWLNIRISRVSDTLFQQTFVDVSERHRLAEQRTALLKEMSHRVLNNFQMIAGFLHLGAATVDGHAKAQFELAGQRIQVLSRMHSFLAYTDADTSDIEAGTYLRELCGYLSSTFERPADVTLECKACELVLPADKVVPLGFVVSELVTNSAKYAYPAPVRGVIVVSLTTNGKRWTLAISDTGRGIADGAPKPAGGLGSRLVQRFVSQIGATLETVSDGGVRHRISGDLPTD